MPDILGVVGYVKPGTSPAPAPSAASVAPAPGGAPGAAVLTRSAMSPGAVTATLTRYNSLEPSCLINPNAAPPPPAPKPVTPQTAVGVARPMEKEQKSGNKAQAKTEAPPPRLANKAGEPPFQLELTPEAAVFVTTPSKRPVCADLRFKNTSGVKQGFKVRCTSTEIFRVQPPMGFIDAGQTQNIRIWYHSKQPNATSMKHYFVFCHKKAVTGRSLDDMWAKNARPDGVRRVAAQFREQQ